MDAGRKMLHLPESAVRLIGSTQVITSVYSVIKELLENSLDAGASSVDVKLENYGLDKIEVRDNGCGIKQADVPVFAKRHFTSKISAHADLETLTTYGFRGEALASLCSVSEVSVTTKTEADDVSLTYTLSSEGNIVSTTPSHLGQGTTVCAKGLFKHLPVRKQYHSAVKKKKDDLKNVENLLLAYGLILPKVRFSLRHNKELVWQKVALESRTSVLQTILGKGVFNQMEWHRKESEDSEIQFELCVPKPGSDVSSLSRSSPDRSFLSINSRPVTVKEIDKLIRQYYSNCHACDISRRPVYYLGITLPSRDLDVNIDPNKTTVMATNMSILKEKLEELLLYIYGPLDQAPSWRYREAETEDDKPACTKSVGAPSTKSVGAPSSESVGAPSTKSVGAPSSKSVGGPSSESVGAPSSESVGAPSTDGAKKTSSCIGNQNDQATARVGSSDTQRRDEVLLSSSSSPVVIFHEPNSNEERNGCTKVVQNDGLLSAHEKQNHESAGDSLEKKSYLADRGENSFVGLNGTSKGIEERSMEKELAKEAQEFDLDSSAMNELLSTFPSEKPAEKDQHSVKSVTDLDSSSSTIQSSSGVTSVSKAEPIHSTTVGSESSENLECSEGKERNGKDLVSESRSDKGDDIAGPSGWSHGTSLRSGDGTVIQPVRLLAPSPGLNPGKRPLSPNQSTNKQPGPAEKRGRKLCPAQSTLYDMINNTAVKRPMSARDFFMKDKRATVVQQNPDADYDEVTDILAEMWDQLSDEMRVAFKEKCWHDTQRYNKEVAAAKKEKEKTKATVGGKSKPQTSIRDMVAAASTQPSPQSTLKRKAVRFTSAVDVPFTMKLLKESLGQAARFSGQVYFKEPRAFAPVPSCKAWVCGRGAELCILNIHRLSEAVVYRRLLNQHRLPVHHCQPLRLTESNTGGYWSVLEKLADRQTTVETFTHLTDLRITANGFDVKTWKDAEGKLCAELVGVCGDVPTYNVKDLVEVLQLISNDSSSSLALCRPLKVVNYLKGEAVRMVRQQAGERSREDVQDLLDQSSSFLPWDCSSCLHDRPFFHTLLSDIDSVLASQTSIDDTVEESTVADSQGENVSGDFSSSKSLQQGGSREKKSSVEDLQHVLSLDDLMDFDSD